MSMLGEQNSAWHIVLLQQTLSEFSGIQENIDVVSQMVKEVECYQSFMMQIVLIFLEYPTDLS